MRRQLFLRDLPRVCRPGVPRSDPDARRDGVGAARRRGGTARGDQSPRLPDLRGRGPRRTDRARPGEAVMTARRPLVIVGASYAGLQIAASARESGFEEPILLFGEEPHAPYQRPPLSKGFLTGKTRVVLL